MADNFKAQVLPVLSVDQITDIYLKQNFQALRDFFETQNQLMNFKFFELVFTEETKNKKVAHGFDYIPLDLVITRITGKGKVQFNHGLFTKTDMDISATGPCRVRFFAGSYWNQKPQAEPAADEVQEVAATYADGIADADTPLLVPTGTILSFAGSKVPSGYLLCDGTAYSRASFPDLYAVIAKAWGAGISEASFRVPDLRGRFLRGVDGTAGVDPDKAARTAAYPGGNTGNNVGSAQSDQFRSHVHLLDQGVNNNVNNQPYPWYGAPSLNYPASRQTLAAGGNETRPVNSNVNFIIKT